jgi:hypothetical protein
VAITRPKKDKIQKSLVLPAVFLMWSNHCSTTEAAKQSRGCRVNRWRLLGGETL